MNTFEICYNDEVNNGVQYVRFGRKDISPIAPLLPDELQRARTIQRPVEKTGEVYDEMLDETVDVMTTVPDKYLLWNGILTAMTPEQRMARDAYDYEQEWVVNDDKWVAENVFLTYMQTVNTTYELGITSGDSYQDAIAKIETNEALDEVGKLTVGMKLKTLWDVCIYHGTVWGTAEYRVDRR